MPKLTSQSGSTLIEVLVSMFLVVVLALLYISAINSVTITKKINYEDIAYHIANKQMEALRETAFASLPSSGTISDSLLTQIPAGSGSFTVADYASMSGMKEMTVTVNWNDGSPKQVVFKSLAGSGGLNP